MAKPGPSGRRIPAGLLWAGEEACSRCGGPYWMGCECFDPPSEDADEVSSLSIATNLLAACQAIEAMRVLRRLTGHGERTCLVLARYKSGQLDDVEGVTPLARAALVDLLEARARCFN